jgi:hypothetical protein
MPHTRLDRLTYTVHGATEAELIREARARLAATVTDVEQWLLAVDAEADATSPKRVWQWTGTVVATRRPTPKPVEATP